VNELSVTFTGSLKLTVKSEAVGTSTSLFAGNVAVTVGAALPSQLAVWLPDPPKVSVAKPSH
jgi:hypothetical protein